MSSFIDRYEVLETLCLAVNELILQPQFFFVPIFKTSKFEIGFSPKVRYLHWFCSALIVRWHVQL